MPVSRALPGRLRHATERRLRARRACGRSVFGGTTLVLSDMLGNNHLAISGEVNGRLSEARAFLGYTNLVAPLAVLDRASRRRRTTSCRPTRSSNTREPASRSENQQITTYVARQAFGVTAYPFNRFTRIEFGAGFNNIDRSRWFVTRQVFDGTRPAATRSTARTAIRRSTTSTASSRWSRTTRCSATPARSWAGGIRFQVSPVTGIVRLDRVPRRLPALRSDHLQLSHDRDARSTPISRSARTRRSSRSTSRGRTSCAATTATARST